MAGGLICVLTTGPSNRSNSVSSLDLEGESVSELGAGPSGSNGVEALQLLEHEQGVFVGLTVWGIRCFFHTQDFST